MRILSWHGYLLRGSGSNIYAANTARAWRRAGHEVLLMCQERDPAGLDLIDAAGDFDPDNSGWHLRPTGVPRGPGRCLLARPAIGEVLPVYVYDDYEGFTAKTFVELDDDELDRYVRANVAALRTALRDFAPEAVLVGHEVMGPYIAALACRDAGIGFVAKLHGSALEYAVKRDERYLRYAQLGLGAATVVVGASAYMCAEAARVVPAIAGRTVVVNPGCDVERFVPQRAADHPPTVGFVGKLIAAKGVHHLLAALGSTATPGLRCVIVGYGGLRPRLEALAVALGAGDRDAAVRIAGEAPDREPLEPLPSLLRDAPSSYLRRCAEVPVRFAGRLDHDALPPVLAGFDLLVVPSVVPEAFGMVAAEAAACGVLPVVPRHSGIGELGQALEDELGCPGWLTYDPGDPVTGIAHRIDALLGLDARERAALGERAAEVARRRWSWDRVAEALAGIAAASAPSPEGD